MNRDRECRHHARNRRAARVFDKARNNVQINVEINATSTAIGLPLRTDKIDGEVKRLGDRVQIRDQRGQLLRRGLLSRQALEIMRGRREVLALIERHKLSKEDLVVNCKSLAFSNIR